MLSVRILFPLRSAQFTVKNRLPRGSWLYDIPSFVCCWLYFSIDAARTFSLGEPADDIKQTATTAAGVMDIVRDCLRPNLPVAELNQRVMDYYHQHQLWQCRGWIGGYEMGIAFLSDWVGNFVYDPLAEKNSARLFEPGTVVNHESQIFLPRHSGQYFMVESLLFGADEVRLATESVDYDLIVIER